MNTEPPITYAEALQGCIDTYAPHADAHKKEVWMKAYYWSMAELAVSSDAAAPADLWALVQAYVLSRIDCVLNPEHKTAWEYLRLAENDLRDALAAQSGQPSASQDATREGADK